MTARLTQPGEVLSLTGFCAMDHSDHPLAIVNPAATPRDAVAWAVDELGSLHFMLDLLACSSADSDVDPAQLAHHINTCLVRVHTVLKRSMEVMARGDVQP